MNPIKRTPSNESHEANPIKNELQQFQQVRQLTSRQALVDSFKCFKCFKCFLQMRVRSSDLQIFSDHFRSFPITSDFFYNSTQILLHAALRPTRRRTGSSDQATTESIAGHHKSPQQIINDHHRSSHLPTHSSPHHPHCV